MSQQQILRDIQMAQHGQCTAVVVHLLIDGSPAMQRRCATEHLAWNEGESWKSLNTRYSYQIAPSEPATRFTVTLLRCGNVVLTESFGERMLARNSGQCWMNLSRKNNTFKIEETTTT